MAFDVNAAKTAMNVIFGNLKEKEKFVEYFNNPRSSSTHTVSKYLPEGYHIACGCTRAVVWCDDYPEFVFKWQIDDSVDIDYSRVEELIYTKACDRHIEECFAPVRYISGFTINKQRRLIYASVFCDMDEESITEESEEYAYQRYLDDTGYEDNQEARDKFYSGDYSDTDAILDMAESYWGDAHEVAIELLREVVEDTYGANLDLHSGNVGKYKGMLVCTDYAGYGYESKSRSSS